MITPDRQRWTTDLNAEMCRVGSNPWSDRRRLLTEYKPKDLQKFDALGGVDKLDPLKNSA